MFNLPPEPQVPASRMNIQQVTEVPPEILESIPKIKLPVYFRPLRHQIPFWRAVFVGTPEEPTKKKVILVWNRRAGKDVAVVNALAKLMIESKVAASAAYIFPTFTQAKRAIWNGYMENGVRILSCFPGFESPDPENDPTSLVKRVLHNEMFIELKNGCTIQFLGSTDPSKLVGANYLWVVLSEYALHENDLLALITPMIAKQNGWIFICSTVRGTNHYYQLYKRMLDDPEWFVDYRTVQTTYDTSGRTLEYVVEASRGMMSEAMVRQEYYNDWFSANESSIYANEMQFLQETTPPRITSVPYDPMLPVHTAWDIGYGDATSVWFFQLPPSGAEIRLINYYEKNRGYLQEHIQHLHHLRDTEGYVYGTHLAPHDIKVNEWAAGASRLEIAMQNGLRFTPVPKLSVQEGIEATKLLLRKAYIDQKKCFQGISAIRQYSRKPTGRTLPDGSPEHHKDPLHDWSSHAADALRYLAVGHRMAQREVTVNGKIHKSAVGELKTKSVAKYGF